MRVVESFPRKVRNIENIWIAMPDGCRLAARLWLPEDAEQRPVPAILECMPFRKRDFTRLRDEALHHYFAGYGYAALRLDLRGTGDSEGICVDEYSPQELDDIADVMAWVRRQPWCTGDVGMFDMRRGRTLNHRSEWAAGPGPVCCNRFPAAAGRSGRYTGCR
jgi:predicted acyl esterase